MEYKFTIEEIESAFDGWIEKCGINKLSPTVAHAWHGIAVQLVCIAAKKQGENVGEIKCSGCSSYHRSCQHKLIPNSVDCLKNFESYP